MYVVGLALAIVVRRFFQPAADRHLAVTGALACVLIAFVGVGLYGLKSDVAWDRMNDLLDRDRVSSITARETAAHATFEMARDELWLGHGSGSFRFIFPRYQQPYPSLGVEAGVIRSFWEHAHNDYAEALAEWGLVGVLPLFAILVFWLARAIRLECWRHPALLVLLAGLAMPMLHSWVDFNAHNPAVLTTWCALWPCLVRWLEIEERA
jgi:O-antigen ligase